MVIYGPNGSFEEICIKEWDGEKVTMEGVRLNLSRFLMILHNAEIIDHTIDKILKRSSRSGHKDSYRGLILPISQQSLQYCSY